MQTVLLLLAIAGIAWSITVILLCLARLLGGNRWNI